VDTKEQLCEKAVVLFQKTWWELLLLTWSM
jgi:hypothetical protein